MHNRTLRPVILFLISAILVSGCAKKPGPEDRALAEVSNKTITVRDFRAKIAKLPPYYQTIIERNKKRYLDDIIMEQLLYEEAVRKGVDRDKEVREILNEAKKKIVITKYIENEVEKKVSVSQDEMKKFYDDHKDDFKAPSMWRASHILVPDEKQAQNMQARLAKGESFEELAGKYSIDATASRGGDVGYFREGQLVPEFEKECLKLDVGRTSGIVHTQFGYHIIKLTDKKEPAIELYDNEKVAGAIEGDLKRKKRGELFDELAERLKKKYNVRVREDAFESLDKDGKAAETPQSK